VVLAAIPVLWFLEQFVRHYAGQGHDFLPLWNAGRNLLQHHPLYFQGRPAGGPDWPDIYYLFLYPPSMLLLVWPLSLLGFSSAKLLFFLADAAAILVAAGLCLELFGIRWRSRTGILVLAGLFLALPVTNTLHNEQVNGLVVLAQAAMLVAAARRRWVLAAVLLGVSLMIKPILLPLVLIFLLARQWRAALLALAIPAGLSLAILPFTADGGQFFTQALPLLVRGNAAYFQKWNVSLAGEAAVVGVPQTMALLLRGLFVAAGAVAIWLRWKRKGDETLRLVEVSGLIILITLLGFSFAWQEHIIFLLPLALSAWHPDSLLRHPLAWLGIYLAVGQELYFMERAGGLVFQIAMARITLGLLLVFVVMAAPLIRQRRAEPSMDVRVETGSAAPRFGVP
jgi:arabinofuranan 3-O-arabinosyltransferase